MIDEPSSDEMSDLYATLKSLQKSLEFLDIQEEYIKDEMKNLKRELIRAKEVTLIVEKLNYLRLMLIYILSDIGTPPHTIRSIDDRSVQRNDRRELRRRELDGWQYLLCARALYA